MSQKPNEAHNTEKRGYQPKPPTGDAVEFPEKVEGGYQPKTEPKDVQPPGGGPGIEPPKRSK